MTRDEALDTLNNFSKVFTGVLTEEQIIIWIPDLCRYEILQAAKAFDDCYRKKIFWPTIQEFKAEIAKEIKEFQGISGYPLVLELSEEERNFKAEFLALLKKLTFSNLGPVGLKGMIDSGCYEKIAEKYPEYRQIIMDCKRAFLEGLSPRIKKIWAELERDNKPLETPPALPPKAEPPSPKSKAHWWEDKEEETVLF